MRRVLLQVIASPFHDGLRDVGMGRGATLLASDERLLAGLRAPGWHVRTEAIAPVDADRPEVARVVELDRRLAGRVRAARRDGAFPLVLAGNCNSCLGTAAGAGPQGLGVVWFDAHADFDTPEDNRSGFFDVMCLAILTGSGWTALRQTIPGFAAIPERDVVLAGVRDLEPYQRERLARSAVHAVPGPVEPRSLAAALASVHERVRRVYLHVDLDVLDTSVGRANAYAAPGGPAVDTLLDAIAAAFGSFAVEAAAITAYDPRCDPDGSIADAARRVTAAIAALAAAQRRS